MIHFQQGKELDMGLIGNCWFNKLNMPNFVLVLLKQRNIFEECDLV
jgi:hypothetical protein